MMELLAPAGSREALAAAVQNGADAVYFGGSILNARRFADNFEGEGLVNALDYCHERGVRAYITLNTLVFDREIDTALAFAGEIHKYGADAVIVQDLGLAALIKNEYPSLSIHASTQMGIHDIGGLEYCKNIGIARAVLAREVSIEDIRLLKNASVIELEAFGHGALCMSFSGSCLYSSMAGERSGNRGTCAQPCRKCASVSGSPMETDRCLSPNDICMIEHLQALEDAGVCCIKLEGRMKKPEYVATVTRCYRAALDGADKAQIAAMKRELFDFFNRGDFSTSHFFFDSVKTDRVGSSKPETKAVKDAKQSFDGEQRKLPADALLKLRVGSPARLDMTCRNKRVSVFGAVVQPSQKPQSEENYLSRLAKLGDTPFRLENGAIEMDSDCYISAAELNALRRDASNALAEAFHIRNTSETSGTPFVKTAPKRYSADARKKPVYCVVNTIDQARIAFENGADTVGIVPCGFTLDEIRTLKRGLPQDKKLFLALPNVLITAKQREYVKKLVDSGLFDGAEANSIGQLTLIRDMKTKFAGIGLNALNSYTVSELLRLGFDAVIPSAELAKAQLEALAAEYGQCLILSVHARTPVMQFVHCPVKEHLGCQNCAHDAGTITDEAGRVFPLDTVRFDDKCLVRMLNCRESDLIDIIDELPRCAVYGLDFTAADDRTIVDRLSAFFAAVSGQKVEKLQDATRGHYNRKID